MKKSLLTDEFMPFIFNVIRIIMVQVRYVAIFSILFSGVSMCVSVALDWMPLINLFCGIYQKGHLFTGCVCVITNSHLLLLDARLMFNTCSNKLHSSLNSQFRKFGLWNLQFRVYHSVSLSFFPSLLSVASTVLSI